MTGWGKFFAGLAMLLAGCYAAYAYFFPSYTHRYRLTMEAEINGETKTGSGIVTVRVDDNGPLTGLANGLRLHTSAWGQAPAIDLGNRGVLVAVLDPYNFPHSYQPRPLPAKEISFAAYYGRKTFTTSEQFLTAAKEISHQQGRRTLDPSDYPGLVWVREPQNSESADAVMPTELGKIVDPTLHLKSISVEITNESNTGQIFTLLPWLRNLREEEKAHGTLMRNGVYSANARQFWETTDDDNIRARASGTRFL